MNDVVMRQDGSDLRVEGDLSVAAVARAELPDSVSAERISLGAVSRLDTAGAWLLLEMARRAGDAPIVGATVAQSALIARVQSSWPTDAAAPVADGLARRVADLGRSIWNGVRELLGLVSALGRLMVEIGGLLRRTNRLRATSLVHHMQTTGLEAVPIVMLMAFLIGVVVAFQGATQLERFGAELFVVDLIGISILRELGILLTAIIVAGRSASAFTASIGAMKMREEIDALRALGLDPETVLVAPRVFALILMLPVLAILANIAGLVGGATMAWLDLGVSPQVFADRIAQGIGPWHLAVGLIKAPVFALIIGLVGCRNGMRVGGDAASLGRLTSASVVSAIFLVIAADALFSIFFAVVGV